MSEYDSLKKSLARGWNTWNTRSVLSHVLLPSGFAVNLGVKEYYMGSYLKEALVGRQGKEVEVVRPGRRSWDGSYTEVELKWWEVELRIQSATDGEDLVLLVTPRTKHRRAPMLVVESGILWNRPGTIAHEGDHLVARLPEGQVKVFVTHPSRIDPNVAIQTPCLSAEIAAPVGVCTGRPRSVEEIAAIVEGQRRAQDKRAEAYGDLAEVYSALQTCLAWDTIYEPLKQRVVSPVSRIWNNYGSGGYVLFCWDNYFAGYIASVDNREVAYSNVIEITREKTEGGFIPNYSAATGSASRDRSQAPVGSLVVRELYRKFGERWLLEELYDDLLVWNRWRDKWRSNGGLCSWGSNPYEAVVGGRWETIGVNERQGAALESGLDNSPLFDDVPFSKEKHMLELQDVGLTSLYVADCRALAEIATILGRKADAGELAGRGDEYARNLAGLWNEPAGVFLDRRSDTVAPSSRIAPSNLYPMLARVATLAQAQRMMESQFYNPKQFWGQWIMPSIARSDPAYKDQAYWRGRIWAPMNLMVYWGMRNYDLPRPRADLARKSQEVLLKEWLEKGHVHENYNADTGEGCDSDNSDRFYHWGGLLGMPAMIEAGHVGRPEEAIGGK